MLTLSQRQVLLIGLDGLEISFAEKLMAEGRMPALEALRSRSASFYLDHGSAQRTGLAWEHVASGRSPEAAKRWSVIEFSPDTYTVRQEGSHFVPCFEKLDATIAVFDPPYFDLSQSKKLEGIVGWGAHDPGVPLQGSTESLLEEFLTRFGSYPSPQWIYEFPCYSPKKCEQMGKALVKAIKVRQQAALWLLSEHFNSHDLFYLVTGELHSAIEALWHGVDPHHPLHNAPSAKAAEQALIDVHEAVDQMIAALVAAVPERDVVAFAMGGMGANHSDLQSMVLLPELLYQNAFDCPFLKIPQEWSRDPNEIPTFSPSENWHRPYAWLQPHNKFHHWQGAFHRKAARALQQYFPNLAERFSVDLYWQPSIYYQQWWSKMPAFALPSFYDGRIRINLVGREKRGIVPLEDYSKICQHLEHLLRDCRDPRTGEAVVADIERPAIANPYDLDHSDADMVVIWQGMSTAFTHPKYGVIGPVPYRRTGGHTGPHGVALIATSALSPGFHGVKSAFDIIPTVAEMLGQHLDDACSGVSLIDSCVASQQSV